MPVLADTPYKIEVKELPIKGYYEMSPSMYGNFIAYKSDINEISVYDLTSGKNKVIAKLGLKVSEPQVFENHIIYTVIYRDNFRELMNYDIINDKNYILMPIDQPQGYSIAENKIITYAECGLYPDMTTCEDRMHRDYRDPGLIIMDLNYPGDYPPSIGYAKCVEDRFDTQIISNGILKKKYVPFNPKEPIKCKQCNVFTGETVYTDESECKEALQKHCSIGTVAFDSNWEVEFHEGSKLCYSTPDMDYTLFYDEKGITNPGNYNNLAVYEDKIVFFKSNGTVLLGEIKYGNLAKICNSFSFTDSKEDYFAENECKISVNNTCKCKYTLNSEKINFSSSDVYTFNLINLRDDTFVTSFNNELLPNINLKLTEHEQKLKTIEEEKQRKLFQEQERLREEKQAEQKEVRKKRNLILMLILIVISPFIYYFSKPYIRKYKAQKEKERRIQEEKRKIEEERKRKEEEKRIKEEAEFEKTQRAKGLEKYKSVWLKPEQIKEWKEAEGLLETNFMEMKPYEFESYIAKLFRKMGYEATVTRQTGDYGVDIVAKKDKDVIAIQCKKNSIGNNVGAVTVQQVLGAMWKVKANKSIIITTTEFTVQAQEQASEGPIELWDHWTLEDMVKKYFINDKKVKQTNENKSKT
jgi:restriction system protein